MFTLIKREIRDHIVYFLGAAVLMAILIAIVIVLAYQIGRGDSIVYIGLSLPVIVILMIGFSAMGVSQMYTDRARKISAFLSILPVSRNQILLARIVTGILAILTVFLPLIATCMALRYLFAPPIPILSSIIYDIFIVVFLLGLACYFLGLMTGWTTSKIAPAMACLVLTFIISSMIIVKGFGLCIKGILILFIIACLTRTWQKYTSTSL